jgi:hypothetical protein
MNEKEKLDEEVFKQAYIPRNLEEVYDVDRDVDVVARGEGKDVSVTGFFLPNRDQYNNLSYK